MTGSSPTTPQRRPQPTGDDDRIISRYAAATTAAKRREDDRIISRYAAATTAAKRREITLEIPSLPIEIPYRESAASMVRF